MQTRIDIRNSALFAGLAAIVARLTLLVPPGFQTRAFDSLVPSPSPIPRPFDSPIAPPTPLPRALFDRDPRPPMGPVLFDTPPISPTHQAELVTLRLLPDVILRSDQVALSITPTPTPLSNKVFLPLISRFVYLQYGKKGIGDAWQSWQPPNPGTNLAALNFSWLYDWQFSYLPSREQDVRYVRMLWCRGGFWSFDINGNPRYVGDVAHADYTNGFVGRVWLIYNEPDDPGQCDFPDVNAAADYYSGAYDLIKSNDPTAKVLVGGLLWLNTSYTRIWWSTFVNRLSSTGKLYKLEGVHIHLYPKLSTATTRQVTDCVTTYCVSELAQVANNWYEEMHVALGLGDRPIWITETGWLGENSCSAQRIAEIRDNFMQPWSQWFAGDSAWPYNGQIGLNPGYDAISWYVTRDAFPFSACSYLLDNLGAAGSPTSLGAFWDSFQP